MFGNCIASAQTVEEILQAGDANQVAITMLGEEPYGN
jgi:NAD(P)H-nitrite reductase large subunit